MRQLRTETHGLATTGLRARVTIRDSECTGKAGGEDRSDEQTTHSEGE